MLFAGIKKKNFRTVAVNVQKTQGGPCYQALAAKGKMRKSHSLSLNAQVEFYTDVDVTSCEG